MLGIFKSYGIHNFNSDSNSMAYTKFTKIVNSCNVEICIIIKILEIVVGLFRLLY